MVDISDEPQPRKLARAMAHLLEVVDELLAVDEVTLPERPFRATIELLRKDLVEVHAGEKIETDRIWEYVAEPWFRALFTGVQEWYWDQYGAAALKAKGNPPLEGVVLVRGSPFLVQVPLHRSVIEVEGKTAWMYFEAGIGDGEKPRDWLVNGPNFDRLSEEQAQMADVALGHVAGSLRAVQHHLLGAGHDETQSGLRASIRSYLENAARRMRKQSGEEFAFAWMDLQMAAEAALKLVIFRGTGQHPHWHDLGDLLKHEAASGVRFDTARLSSWPSFSKISNRRYGKDYLAGLSELYDAYNLILDLVVACISTIAPPLPPGAGFLIHVGPWLIDDPLLRKQKS